MSTTPPSTPESAAPEAPGHGPPPSPRTCTHCGSALADGQGWCLECGAAAPGSLRTRVPTRAAAIIAAATVGLVLAAAGAAYAALHTSPHKVVLTAAAPPPAPPAPSAGTTGPTTPTPLTPAVVPPAGTTTPTVPKVTPPATPPPPVSSASITTTAAAVTPPPTVAPPTTSTQTTTTQTSSAPTALLLDSNATSDYDPNNLGAQAFGDPNLAIDGDTTTSWSAQVPVTPPVGGSAGLLVDLNSGQSLASLKLVTHTSGATFAVLGANGAHAPATIAATGWTQLAAPVAVKKSPHTFALKTKGHRYRWVLLWILGVKGGAVATLPSTVAGATAASTAAVSTSSTQTLSASALSSSGSTTTSTTSTTSTTTSTSTTVSGPPATVDVNELTLYP